MTVAIDSELQDAYEAYHQFLRGKDIELLKKYVSENCMAYGSAIDESSFTLRAIQDIMERNNAQSAGMEMSFVFNPVFQRMSEDKSSAIIVDEADITMQAGMDKHEIFMRISYIMEKLNENWMLVHLHCSVPPVASADDAWHADEWKRRNEELQKLVAERTRELEQSLENLKSTQVQLIHSEKMASLGELTAGIAHEIQNPLNFVNNFSEVSKELLVEMQEALKNGNNQEAYIIASDVMQNLDKILYHGNRADGIVKGMLQHARISGGTKEPTDINSLVEEYVRLAYHGQRAKDKSFNATIQTDFDNSIGTINVIPQDIGRVLLNLLTNALYTVSERKKQHPDDYEPIVSVSTKKISAGFEIRIKDNGNGIPDNLKKKIFQPFFTTKPTGQGTGLGLSISFDIITKGHGGEIRVVTKEGEGSEFIIVLPK